MGGRNGDGEKYITRVLAQLCDAYKTVMTNVIKMGPNQKLSTLPPTYPFSFPPTVAEILNTHTEKPHRQDSEVHQIIKDQQAIGLKWEGRNGKWIREMQTMSFPPTPVFTNAVEIVSKISMHVCKTSITGI